MHSVDSIVSVLATLQGHRRDYGQGGDLLTHSLKCAALAMSEGSSDELIAAALLHDIGHALLPLDDEFDEFPDRDLEHAFIGGYFLQGTMPKRVCRLIEKHVDAKRYLMADDARLHGMQHEGFVREKVGAMPAPEASEFRADHEFDAVLTLRRWDWECDEVIHDVPQLQDMIPLLRRLAACAEEERQADSVYRDD
jgi:predicted HD phosphohydrolase